MPDVEGGGGIERGGVAGVGGGVGGVEGNGLLEGLEAVREVLLIKEVAAAQVGVVRGGVDGRARRGRGEDEAGLGGDLLGDAVLEREDIGGGAFKGLGPEVAVGASVDELGGDADAVAGADDGAFDDGVDVELAGDVGKWAAGALVGHDGGAGDDAKVGDTGELGDELVGHAVGEVLLGGVAGEVVEGEDGERADGGATGSMEEAGSQRMGAEGEYRNAATRADAHSGGQPKSVPWFAAGTGCGRGRDLGRSSGVGGGEAPTWSIGRSGRLGDVWLNGL